MGLWGYEVMRTRIIVSSYHHILSSFHLFIFSSHFHPPSSPIKAVKLMRNVLLRCKILSCHDGHHLVNGGLYAVAVATAGLCEAGLSAATSLDQCCCLTHQLARL